MNGKGRCERLAAAGGLISLVLFLIAWFVHGKGPGTGDEAATIFRFFADHRERVLWALFIQGLGALAMIWFMSALVLAMRDAGELLLAVATGLTLILALALGSAATMMRMGVAFTVTGSVDPETVATIFRLGHILDTSQNIISAGFFFTVALATLSTRFIPAWWGWVSLAAGLWAVVSTTAWDFTGFWSPEGAGFLNMVFYIVWVGGTSILLMMRTHKDAA
jgi:hypothetical protein